MKKDNNYFNFNEKEKKLSEDNARLPFCEFIKGMEDRMGGKETYWDFYKIKNKLVPISSYRKEYIKYLEKEYKQKLSD